MLLSGLMELAVENLYLVGWLVALLNQVMSSTLQINNQQLSIVSYNCSGFKHSRDYINTFLAASTCVILCLQETWLLETNMELLSTSHADYSYTGVSGVEEIFCRVVLMEETPSFGTNLSVTKCQWSKLVINGYVLWKSVSIKTVVFYLSMCTCHVTIEINLILMMNL